MFLGVEGLRNLGISDFSIEGEKHDVPGTIGVKINLHYQAEEGEPVVYIETNIPENIWHDPENSLLRQKVLCSIASKGKVLDIGTNQENQHIAFRLQKPLCNPQPYK